jgi:hypothetical protein
LKKLLNTKQATIYLLFVIIFLLQGYTIFKYASFILFDEWLGRGLYPGIAFFNAFDFYEPKSGPHVTLYGWATGLFYSLSGLANNPNVSAWIAFALNIVSFLGVSYFLIKKICLPNGSFNKASFGGCLTCLVFTLHLLDPTTEGISRIHADLPALFFLMLGILFFLESREKDSGIYLSLCALMLVLSAWAKLPTLFVIGLPFFVLLMEKQFRLGLHYLFYSSFYLLLTTLTSGIAYGFEDMKFILWDHTQTHTLNDRNNLFNGEGADNINLTFLETILFLFKFCLMYVSEYFYFIFAALASLTISFTNVIDVKVGRLLRSLGLAYFLLIPPCIAALARYGGVENSLLLCNSIGIFCLLTLAFLLLSNYLSSRYVQLFFAFLCLVLLLPLVRTAKSFDQDPNFSPQLQAFNYLSKGNTDVYFGWYPVSHALFDKSNLTCIEVPTYIVMNLPDEIDFSKNHFPEGAKYLATCHVGYGSGVLQYYLGKLEEVKAPPELSGWRLFQNSKFPSIQ